MPPPCASSSTARLPRTASPDTPRLSPPQSTTTRATAYARRDSSSLSSSVEQAEERSKFGRSRITPLVRLSTGEELDLELHARRREKCRTPTINISQDFLAQKMGTT